MDLRDAIRDRHSVRLYRDEPIDPSVVGDLLDAACRAPSAMNSQPWFFHVATGEKRKEIAGIMANTTAHLSEYVDLLPPEELEQAAEFYANLGGAPVIIGVSVLTADEDFMQRNYLLSVGAAIENFLLTAYDRGLGACSVTAPDWLASQLTMAFEVPDGRILTSLLVVGKSAEDVSGRQRVIKPNYEQLN